jgi:hypothetical protein
MDSGQHLGSLSISTQLKENVSAGREGFGLGFRGGGPAHKLIGPRGTFFLLNCQLDSVPEVFLGLFYWK